LEDSLRVLQKGKPVTVLYSTRFLINWPVPLGGGSIGVDLEGSMTLLPLFSAL